jgi:hypothetical protein
MIQKKQTTPILFSAGAYGSFLEWALLYFSGQTDIKDPIGRNGNSHNLRGRHLLDMSGWRNYLNSDNHYPLVRLHPKTLDDESIIDNVNEILSFVDKAILIYCGYDTLLLNINNKFEKVWEEGWLAHTQVSFKKNLQGWGKNKLADMSIWEIREFLSFFILAQHLDESGLDAILSYQSPTLIKVNVSDLLSNFESTIKLLLNWCNFDRVRSDFDRVYHNWAAAQKHQFKDRLVNNIVQSVVSQGNLDWSNEQLTIVDEAFIQMKLRDLHKLELRCYNLNVFPTNTPDLRNLLFDV